MPEEHIDVGVRSADSSATGAKCLIGQRLANEDLAIIFMVFEQEIFLKFLFQSVSVFSCYINDQVGPTSCQ